MGCMFFGCSSLINIDLFNINNKNTLDKKDMFNGCNSLINKNYILFYI